MALYTVCHMGWSVDLHVRSGPSKSSPSIGRISIGETVRGVKKVVHRTQPRDGDDGEVHQQAWLNHDGGTTGMEGWSLIHDGQSQLLQINNKSGQGGRGGAERGQTGGSEAKMEAGESTPNMFHEVSHQAGVNIRTRPSTIDGAKVGVLPFQTHVEVLEFRHVVVEKRGRYKDTEVWGRHDGGITHGRVPVRHVQGICGWSLLWTGKYKYIRPIYNRGDDKTVRDLYHKQVSATTRYVCENNDENEDPYTAVPKRMNMNPLIDLLPELPI